MAIAACGFVSSKNSIVLKQVGADFADLLAKIHEECFPTYWNNSDFTNFFSVKNTYALLAWDQDLAAGMMVYRISFEQADIITLAVRSPWRRQGVAKSMLAQAMAHCKALGAEKFFLEVEVGNQPALALYQGLGFTQVSRRKLYYRQKDGTFTDALVMSYKFS